MWVLFGLGNNILFFVQRILICKGTHKRNFTCWHNYWDLFCPFFDWYWFGLVAYICTDYFFHFCMCVFSMCVCVCKSMLTCVWVCEGQRSTWDVFLKWFLPFKKFWFYYFLKTNVYEYYAYMCVSVSISCNNCRGQKRVSGSPEAGVTGGC